MLLYSLYKLFMKVTAYGEQLHFPSTRVYFVGRGSHVLLLQSRNQAIGLDAVRVFRGTDNTLIIPPPAQSATPTTQPIPAVGIEQVAAPPTVQATLTPRAPEVRDVSVVIAYDENGNRAVDPAEGVVGISVRVIASDTNRELLQTFTDSQGYAQLQVVTDAPMRVVVPYFGRVWDMNSGGSAHFTLLLEPGTQPGLIP